MEGLEAYQGSKIAELLLLWTVEIRKLRNRGAKLVELLLPFPLSGGGRLAVRHHRLGLSISRATAAALNLKSLSLSASTLGERIRTLDPFGN